MIRRFAAARAAALAAVVLAGGVARAELTGYEQLADWSDLPNAQPGVQAGLASSYARAGGNSDFNHYLLPEGFLDSSQQQVPSVPTVIADIPGPGILTRILMPHGTANEGFRIKLTVDGTTVLQTDSDTLLGGQLSYFAAPLVSTRVGAQVSYEPVVFAQSLKIESENLQGNWMRDHHYYHYNYLSLPSAEGLTAYSGVLTPSQQAARAAVVDRIANVGQNPAGDVPGAQIVNTPAASVPAGGSLTLAAPTGSGQVRRVNLKMVGASDDDLDALRLRVGYGAHPGWAIDVPVADFFGAGHGRVPYSSLPLGTEGENGFYCYWPMPYRHGMTVELHNTAAAPIGIDSAAVEYLSGPVPVHAGYLHASWASELTGEGQPYHVLFTTGGEGRYVGNMLYVVRSGVDWNARAVLEADDFITVDGQTVLHGTGLEDAYNGGYYYNHVAIQYDDGDVPSPYSGIGPYSGLLRMNFPDLGDDYVRTDQYRWLIGDPVPFTTSIEVKIENFLSPAGTQFGSTAFYYLVLRGDYNGDGEVSGADYVVWAETFGNDGSSGKEDLRADGNGDGVVSGADYVLWANHFGRSIDGE